MFLSINRLSQYNKDGYICFDNIINKKNCPKIIKIVRNFQSKNKFNNNINIFLESDNLTEISSIRVTNLASSSFVFRKKDKFNFNRRQ